jgi:hypothetical protein
VRAKGKGGFLILEYLSPPSLQPSLIDQINVDLTPFVSPQLKFHEFAHICFVVFEFALRFQALGWGHGVVELR